MHTGCDLRDFIAVSRSEPFVFARSPHYRVPWGRTSRGIKDVRPSKPSLCTASHLVSPNPPNNRLRNEAAITLSLLLSLHSHPTHSKCRPMLNLCEGGLHRLRPTSALNFLNEHAREDPCLLEADFEASFPLEISLLQPFLHPARKRKAEPLSPKLQTKVK